ncbi:uncharacterized protein RSE6_01450 [Rhynchosporium secalis]|uniref:SET domain-containing protein n=1 Tax=Rhynchosporium secalis TaxID=38038 RepID=A0A1E1LXW5_RHYSE|nr:uncharacterized protein RSE6_01450 [Rhynchosporium secalis]
MASTEPQMPSSIAGNVKLSSSDKDVTAQKAAQNLQVSIPEPASAQSSMSTGRSKAEKKKRKKENARKNKANALAVAEQQSEQKLVDDMNAFSVHQPGNLDTSAGKQVDKMSHHTEQKDVHVPVPSSLLFEFLPCPEKGGIGGFARFDINKGPNLLVEEAIFKGYREHTCKESLFKVLSREKQDKINALFSRCNYKSTQSTATPLMQMWDINIYDTAKGLNLYLLAARFKLDCFPDLARGFTKDDCIICGKEHSGGRGTPGQLNSNSRGGQSQTRRAPQ